MVQVTQSEFVNTFTPKGKEKIWTELKMTKNKTVLGKFQCQDSTNFYISSVCS